MTSPRRPSTTAIDAAVAESLSKKARWFSKTAGSLRFGRLRLMDSFSEDLAAIKQIALDWNAGWDRGDVEALLALYADQPTLLPQGQPAVAGKDAIRPLYQSVFKDFTIQGDGEVVEVEASGNLGYLWSSYSLTATPKAGGDPITSKGKSLFILKRQADHSWKIARLMDNSDEEA